MGKLMTLLTLSLQSRMRVESVAARRTKQVHRKCIMDLVHTRSFDDLSLHLLELQCCISIAIIPRWTTFSPPAVGIRADGITLAYVQVSLQETHLCS